MIAVGLLDFCCKVTAHLPPSLEVILRLCVGIGRWQRSCATGNASQAIAGPSNTVAEDQQQKELEDNWRIKGFDSPNYVRQS